MISGGAQSLEQLIDMIYEAAVLPDRWKDVLNSLSGRFGAKGGILFTSSLDNVRWLGAGESEQKRPTEQ